MKNNYKIIVLFDGTNYQGWQYQTPEIKTIQGEIVKALTIIAKKKITVYGSSRTDSGVHSTGLTANFYLSIKIEPESLLKALNSLLPQDIRIIECELKDKSFNSRSCAKSKTYIYRIYFGQVISPFKCRYVHHIRYQLNLNNMRKAVKYFIGEHNFSSFTSDEPKKKRTREITEFKMKKRKQEITFIIKGKSFLRYMVRNIIGTIIDVGRDKILPEHIPLIFEAKDRRRVGQAAPAKGLTLHKVEY